MGCCDSNSDYDAFESEPADKSPWAEALLEGSAASKGDKRKDQKDADNVDANDVPECTFLERRYIKEEGASYPSWKIVPAGSAPPPEPPEPTTNEYATRPLVLVTEYDPSGQDVRDRTLQVNSPALKAVITRCLGHRYPKWKVSATDDVEIAWPWQDWFQGLDYFKKEGNRLSEKIAEKTNEGTPRLIRERNTCKLLVDIIEKYHDNTIKEVNECIKHGSITYALIWTLFNTYQELYRKKDDAHRAYEFLSGKYVCKEKERFYEISCRYVDYDGENFGWIDKKFSIVPFKGKLKITSLPIYPLTYHPDKSMREQLITRGRKFESLRGVHYLRYKPSLRGKEVETVAHRVIIDASESDYKPRSYNINSIDLDENTLEIMRTLKEVGYCFSSEESDEETNENGEETEVKELLEGIEEPYTPLPEFYCVFTTHTVGGFDLKNKYWKKCDVMQLTQPTWNTNAFDSLVLEDHKKELIKALVEQHKQDSSGENAFDDFIPGKGKGLIYILHGPPGVGKTLTAEAVSEYTQSPLYVVSAGELGTSSSSIESHLKAAFDLCARWNALMLLDEADVFMEARSLHDIDRNACVSIFLKVLEYYEGILFLTTNRVVSFDEAFRSRVHVALRFDELNHSSRLKIWQAFINRIIANGMEVDISEEELAKLAMKPLNGREIKNAVKLAHSLTRKRGGSLNIQTLLKNVEIQEQFVGDSKKN